MIQDYNNAKVLQIRDQLGDFDFDDSPNPGDQ